MIIKVVTHRPKKDLFRRLVEYIYTDKGRATDINSFSFFNNLSSYTPEGIIQEFEKNDTYRKQRSNGVALHHCILSFSPEDSKHLTHEILQDLAYKFIELRGAKSIAFGRVHNSDGHQHIHLIFSGNEYQSNKSMRMDKKEFQKIHRELEEYQQEKYPQLSHSIVKLHSRNRDKPKGLSEVEKHIENRGIKLRKTSLKGQIKQLLAESNHTLDFYEKLQEKGFLLYRDRKTAKAVGIQTANGRKYRFTTLGIGLKTIRELDEIYLERFSQKKVDRER